MIKRDVLIFAFVLILILPLASAGIFDFITGKSTEQTTGIEANVSNTAPTITSVSVNATVNPSEAGTRGVAVSFIAYDHDGWADLNDSTARLKVTRAGGLTKSVSCSKEGGNIDANSLNFTCSSFDMWYFEEAGAWGLNATILDNSASTAENNTATFTYNSLTAFVLAPSTITYGALSPGNTDKKAANNPTTLNNTGNYDVAVNGILVNATTLVGVSDAGKEIGADLFAISEENATACTGGEGYSMINSTFVPLDAALLNRGNLSIGNETGQSLLWHCLTLVPASATKQTYSTAANGAWTVKIV